MSNETNALPSSGLSTPLFDSFAPTSGTPTRLRWDIQVYVLMENKQSYKFWTSNKHSQDEAPAMSVVCVLHKKTVFNAQALITWICLVVTCRPINPGQKIYIENRKSLVKRTTLSGRRTCRGIEFDPIEEGFDNHWQSYYFSINTNDFIDTLDRACNKTPQWSG